MIVAKIIVVLFLLSPIFILAYLAWESKKMDHLMSIKEHKAVYGHDRKFWKIVNKGLKTKRTFWEDV